MAVEASTILVSILGGVGTGLVGLVGLRLQHRYTANTTQISNIFGEIEKLIDRCAECAGKVWQAEGDPGSSDVAEVICLLHEIAVYSRFVTERVKASKLKLSSPTVNFRNAVSGGDFDVKGRAPDPRRLLDIRASAASLKVACREIDYDRRLTYLPFLDGG